MEVGDLKVVVFAHCFEFGGFDKEGVDVHVFGGIGNAPVDAFDDE